jgi:monovalent cation:proton antiporter-2 (CPA2) family protein
MTDSALFEMMVYLLAAVVCVPLAKRRGLGAVLGYLVAGVLIGPHVLGLVGGGEHVMHVAEFGVVMMLFLVGLELEPRTLWALRRPIFGLGGLQVAGTAGVVGLVALALGLDARVAIAVGLVLSMSSTAIVLQTMTENGLLKTAAGNRVFSVLLFQDIAVIPILALLPLLAVTTPVTPDAPHAAMERVGWVQALLVVGAVALVVLVGRFVMRPLLRYLAETRLREMFTAASLLLVVAVAWLMQSVGVSPALGTFLAGVVLADSEYRHELESEIAPFKGLLLGIFFVSVGAEIDFGLVASAPGTIVSMVFGAMVIKALVLLAIGAAFGLSRSSIWIVAVALSQVGEFAFVLTSFALRQGVFDAGLTAQLSAVTALSMAVTPALFVLLERWILPRVAERPLTRAHDAIDTGETDVVIAGFGRVGQVVGRMVRMGGYRATVLDLDPSIVDLLRRLGQKVYFGDASRLDLLESAGCARARMFVLAIDDPDKSLQVAALVRKHYPDLPILARARNRQHYHDLRRLGVEQVFRETLGSSIEASEIVLTQLGSDPDLAREVGRRWRAHDEAALERMLAFDRKDREAWLGEARKSLDNIEAAMKDEIAGLVSARSPQASGSTTGSGGRGQATPVPPRPQ